MSFQEEWERKKEERQRKRQEMEGDMVNGSAPSSPTKSAKAGLPVVQLKQTPKSPKSLTSQVSTDKPLNEAEKKAEELKKKREQERLEAEQRAQSEIHKTTVTTMTPERKEEIRRAREERERLEKEQEEERKAKAEEETRRMREEIQRRRQEAEAKRKQLQENEVAYSIPKYDIAENVARAKQEKLQTSAELQAERERRVEESLPQIRISARDSEERLREIAAVLHAKLVEVYGDMYDLEQRKERQEYDLNEMSARIKDLSKNKTVSVTTIDRGHVSMLKEKALVGEEKTTKQKQSVDVKASLPSTGNIADRLQKLQSNLKKDAETSEKTPKKEPIKLTYSTPEQLKEELEASKKEVERFRIQREENRRKREEEMRRIEQYEEERRLKAEEERRQQAEERERLKREKEEKEKARRAMIGSPAPATCNIAKVVSVNKAKNREETIAERLPSVAIDDSLSDDELRNIAQDVYNRLKTTVGDVFDLEEQKKKNEYYINELTASVGYLKSSKSSTLVSSGIVSKMKDEGAWMAKKQNGVSSPKSPKPKDLGSIASEGGVRGRMAMFSGGVDGTNSKSRAPAGAPPKVNIFK